MITILLCLPICLGLLLLFLIRKAAIDALSSIVTREGDTLLKVQTALQALGGDLKKVKFVTTKDRSSHFGEKMSRRKGTKTAAKVLENRKKREEKMARIRKSLAEKLNFKKSN